VAFPFDDFNACAGFELYSLEPSKPAVSWKFLCIEIEAVRKPIRKPLFFERLRESHLFSDVFSRAGKSNSVCIDVEVANVLDEKLRVAVGNLLGRHLFTRG